MNTNATAITVLGNLLNSYGVHHILVSPGSRNAPVALALRSMECFEMHSVVDERSSAFIGLGIALKTKKPVAIICTSGSAALNFAPALAEAYYQKVPLIAITADRPAAWIDQLEGQTINQIDLFKNHIRHSINLPVNSQTHEDLAYLKRLINQCLTKTSFPVQGPVHINIPLAEPLYEKPLINDQLIRADLRIQVHQPDLIVSGRQKEIIQDLIGSSAKPMMIVGQLSSGNGLSVFLEKIEQTQHTVILTEHTSNAFSSGSISCIDRTIEGITENQLYSPDLLITFGEAIVSKKIKRWLIDNPPARHLHITEDTNAQIVDTFQSITDTVIAKIELVLQEMSEMPVENTEAKKQFFSRWSVQSRKAKDRHEEFLKSVPYSDLSVFKELFENIPTGSKIHLANSSPVRYAQLFDVQRDFQFLSNRGVSGIDGSLSTAVGYAKADPKMRNIMISGELGFLYDSNALFNKMVPDNLIIIVINNAGGNIFKIIPGPTDFDGSDELIIFDHNFKCKGIAENFGIHYSSVQSIEEIAPVLSEAYSSNKAHLIEIITPEESSEILKNYFKFITA